MRATTFFGLTGALLATFGASSTEATVAAGHAAAQTPAAMYAHALDRLQSVRRLQLIEVGHVYVQHPETFQLEFRYVAPDRLATIAQSKQLDGRILTVERIQVGTVLCQAPPEWACYHSPRQTVTTLVRTYIEPQARGLRFSARSEMRGSGRGRYHATVIHLSIRQGEGSSYVGTLTVNDDSHLPVSFTSKATMKGQLAADQSVSITYGGTFNVNLPRGKNVRLPQP
jgi:hypothetical protein